MIYCLYNSVSNALLGINTVEPVLQDGQSVRLMYREMPDFATEEWNPAILNFFTKNDVAISKREFVKRFTATEYATIKAAAAVNPTLDYYWQMFMLAEFITLSDPDTGGGVMLLEQAGLIGTGRAAEILA